MSDLAYSVMLIGTFVVFALAIRGARWWMDHERPPRDTDQPNRHP
jgi:hypothetical protein